MCKLQDLIDIKAKKEYYPDFYSYVGKKWAATPMNKGFAAFTFCHKYVGESSIF